MHSRLPAEQYRDEDGYASRHYDKKNTDTFRSPDPDAWLLLRLGPESIPLIPILQVDAMDFPSDLQERLGVRRRKYPFGGATGCKSVLANEEVNADGTCKDKVTPASCRRPSRTMVLKITAYAERLLKTWSW